MLERLAKKEVMTVWDAKNKYREKHFCMIITEIVDTQQQDIGYVIYTADVRKEFLEIPHKEYEGLKAGFLSGVATDPEPQIKGIFRV